MTGPYARLPHSWLDDLDKTRGMSAAAFRAYTLATLKAARGFTDGWVDQPTAHGFVTPEDGVGAAEVWTELEALGYAMPESRSLRGGIVIEGYFLPECKDQQQSREDFENKRSNNAERQARLRARRAAEAADSEAASGPVERKRALRGRDTPDGWAKPESDQVRAVGQFKSV